MQSTINKTIYQAIYSTYTRLNYTIHTWSKRHDKKDGFGFQLKVGFSTNEEEI